MELRGTPFILTAILSIVTLPISQAAEVAKPKTPAKKTGSVATKPTPAKPVARPKYPPAHPFKPKPVVMRKAPAEVVRPPFRPEKARGKYLAAQPADKPNQWWVRFAPVEKGLTFDATKTLLISLETLPGASVSPESVFRQQWDAKAQGFRLNYQPGAKGPAEVTVHGAFTVCDSARKACRKVYEDFRFDPTLVATSGKAPPSAAKTPRAP